MAIPWQFASIRHRLLACLSVECGRLDMIMINFKNRPLICSAVFAAAMTGAVTASAQIDQIENPTDDSTIVYPAAYFADFLPVSANDMISRIPGIGLAMRGGGGGGRGLGSGGGEILINGQRTTGKGNTGADLLSRISADQVQHIEIIRGTSEDMDVRGAGEGVNVVVLDMPSAPSTGNICRPIIPRGLLTTSLAPGTLPSGASLRWTRTRSRA